MTIRVRRAATLLPLGLLGCGSGTSPAESMDAAAVDSTAIDAATVDAAADAPIADATTTDTTPPAVTSPDATFDSAAEGSSAFTVSLGTGRAVATFPEREALGFRFGFVDGVMGAVSMGDAGYVFFGSGRTEFPEAGTCSGDGSTPNTQGAYRFGVATDAITDNFGCRALIANGDVVPDGGTQGPFDRDYVGGGPVLLVTSGGQRALVMTYHAEFHWGPTCSGAPCFYGTLGMAASVDDGATFTKLGEIVQPAISRADWISTHAEASLSIGAGPFVLGDATGRPVDPATADPASAYVYVFFDDYDATNTAPCSDQQCVGVARALLQDIADAAFGVATAKPATQLFFKYHTGGEASTFTEPGASGSVDDSLAGGSYTAVLSDAFELSTLYDRTLQEVILAYRAPNSDDIFFRTSGDLLNWPDSEVLDASIHEDGGDRYPSLVGELPNADIGGASPWVFYTNGLASWPTSTFMSRRVNVAAGP
jgi:hypothetical protein